jgi:hypothetical protein
LAFAAHALQTGMVTKVRAAALPKNTDPVHYQVTHHTGPIENLAMQRSAAAL